jgi:hypothetical protein
MPEIDQDDIITKGGVKTLINQATEALTTKFNAVTTGVLVVLGLGFITLLLSIISPMIDAWRFRSATYEELKNQVLISNSKIDFLTQQIQINGYIKKPAPFNP